MVSYMAAINRASHERLSTRICIEKGRGPFFDTLSFILAIEVALTCEQFQVFIIRALGA
jgi:hypothetical protein